MNRNANLLHNSDSSRQTQANLALFAAGKALVALILVFLVARVHLLTDQKNQCKTIVCVP